MKNKVWINYFHDHYTYDANGNPTLVTNDSTNTTREMYWDEDNRLMVLSDNGKTSRYTYNAAGERIMKSHGTMEGVYINGALYALPSKYPLCQQEQIHEALLPW